MPYTTWQDGPDTVVIYYEVVGHGEPVVFHHGTQLTPKLEWRGCSARDSFLYKATSYLLSGHIN